MRDILINARPDQRRHDDRAAWLCKRYFDAVLVHADPRLARFEESFAPSKPLAVPLHYTGFVSAVRPSEASSHRRDGVLVSAGGGLVGYPLLSAALQAQCLLPPSERMPMKLVAGPFLPEPQWQQLQALALSCPDVTLLRSVPALAGEMRSAAISISQCGYNTAMDILASGVAALVVPYAAEREDEQVNRAQRLEQLGVLRMLPPDVLNAANLAGAIGCMREFDPRASTLDLDGAQRSASLIAEMLRRRHEQQHVKAACAV